MDISYKKTEEKYVLTKLNPANDKEVSINLTVHLDNDLRKLSITGKHDKFEFRNSEPDLLEAIVDLMKEAIQVGHAASRVTKE